MRKIALVFITLLSACGGASSPGETAQNFLVEPRSDIVAATVAVSANAGNDGDVFRVETNGDFVAEIEGRVYRIPSDLAFNTYDEDNGIPNVDGFMGANAGGEFYANGDAVAFAGYISNLSMSSLENYFVFSGYSGVTPAPAPTSDLLVRSIYKYQEEAIQTSDDTIEITDQRGPIWLVFSVDDMTITEIVPRDGASFETEPTVDASFANGEISGTFGFEGSEDPFNGRQVPLTGVFSDNSGSTSIFAKFGDDQVQGVIFPDNSVYE